MPTPMYVSPPRAAKDDLVRVPATKDEAQALARTSAMLVPDKSKFLPLSGVSVRSRPHVIFLRENDTLRVQVLLGRNHAEVGLIQIGIEAGEIRATDVNCSVGNAYEKMTILKGADVERMIDSLHAALGAMPRLEGIQDIEPLTAFADRLRGLWPQVEKAIRDILTEAQEPVRAELDMIASLNRGLEQVPLGSLVVDIDSRTGAATIRPLTVRRLLKPKERIYVLNAQSDIKPVLDCLSSHAGLSFLTALKSGPEENEALMPPGTLDNRKIVVAPDFRATTKQIQSSGATQINGVVHLVEPKSYQFGSYDFSLFRPYKWALPWRQPVTITSRSKALPKTPKPDLFTINYSLFCSARARAVLETLSLGSTHFIPMDDDPETFLVYISEEKPGPLDDDTLFEQSGDGFRRPAKVDGIYLSSNIPILAPRLRFPREVLEGTDLWRVSNLDLGYDSDDGGAPLFALSEHAIAALKAAKIKWHKPPKAAPVVA